VTARRIAASIGHGVAPIAWVIGSLVVALLGGAACGGELARPATGEAVRRETLQRGDIVDRQLLTGEIRAVDSLGIGGPRTEIWQLTIRWIAEDGSAVKAGDKLIEFDNTAYAEQLATKHLTMLEAEMTMRGARDLGAISIAGKQTELQQHQIALDKARARASVPPDLLAGREAQDRQLALKRAEVAVDKAERGLAGEREQTALEERIKQLELDKAKRAIDAAEATIAHLAVTAPRDGIVMIEEFPWFGRKVRVGDIVPPGIALLSLADANQKMGVRAELSDVDDGRIAAGMSGTCALDAYPREAQPCTVKTISPVARTKGENSLRRTFAIELALDKTVRGQEMSQEMRQMRPGMSVRVELHPRTAANAVIVPRGAIVAAAGADHHARVRMASGELRDVTLGLCDAQRCAAEAGVSAGDVVVLGGAP
jgi:multidrug efflux pump subunit AcrA (membrane-fusion protein)